MTMADLIEGIDYHAGSCEADESYEHSDVIDYLTAHDLLLMDSDGNYEFIGRAAFAAPHVFESLMADAIEEAIELERMWRA